MATHDDENAEWLDLINSVEPKPESVFQQFLEAHPWFLPGARTLTTRSGHHPWPSAIVSQPPLPSLSTKIPDFMWIAVDSTFLSPILIEIETPWKRWFQSANVAQHSELTTPLSQVAHWRKWFNKPENQVAFYNYYRIPRWGMDLTLRPQFLIVHGRRSEASATPERAAFRGALAVSLDTRLVTFDHLHPDQSPPDYFTVVTGPGGFTIHPNSPKPDPAGLTSEVRSAIEGLADPDSPPPGYRFTPPPPPPRRRSEA